ncbi:MAG: hypothetical protein ACOX6N_01185 [Patescibacteria group bacterium]|jgi:hypothetical protein
MKIEKASVIASVFNGTIGRVTGRRLEVLSYDTYVMDGGRNNLAPSGTINLEDMVLRGEAKSAWIHRGTHGKLLFVRK